MWPCAIMVIVMPQCAVQTHMPHKLCAATINISINTLWYCYSNNQHMVIMWQSCDLCGLLKAASSLSRDGGRAVTLPTVCLTPSRSNTTLSSSSYNVKPLHHNDITTKYQENTRQSKNCGAFNITAFENFVIQENTCTLFAATEWPTYSKTTRFMKVVVESTETLCHVYKG